MKIKQVIIWGHPLMSHTHSYIHEGFYKAFKHLGYDTYWFTDNDETSSFDFSNSLFITEGQVDKNIPMDITSWYVLHNCDVKRYTDHACKCLIIQVLTKDVYNIEGIQILNKYTMIDKANDINCLYMCWATDLLPHEINPESAKNNQMGGVVWVGSLGGWGTTHGNASTVSPFLNKCLESGLQLLIVDPWSNPISSEENSNMVNNAFLAPSIQGEWQVEVGYVPCRIFKNISYGHFGYTNSEFVNDIFDGKLVYEKDTTILFGKCIEKKADPNHIEELKELMEIVRDNHTYINRIEVILQNLPRI